MSTSATPAMVTPEPVEQKIGVFVSHKHDDGRVAERIKQKFEELAPDRLEVHISELIPKGEEWNPVIHQQLRDSRLLLLLYTGPGPEWDWCLYESGFFLGAHEGVPKRLVCLHQEGVALPAPLTTWEAATEQSCVQLLYEIFKTPLYPGAKPINPKVTDETLQQLVEYVMRDFTTRPEPIVLTPYIELTLNGAHKRELDRSGMLAGDIPVTDDGRAKEIFGLRSKAGATASCWNDISRQLDQTRQTGWARAIADSIRRLCSGRNASTTFPVVYSADGTIRRRWRPILYSTQATGNTETFRIAFSEIQPDDDPRPEDARLDHCMTLLTMSRMIRFGMIEKYRALAAQWRDRQSLGIPIDAADLEDKLGSLLPAIDRLETEAVNAGLRSLENVLDVFGRSDEREKFAAWTREWVKHRQRLAHSVANRDLDSLATVLDDMRTLNRQSAPLIIHRYAQLLEEVP